MPNRIQVERLTPERIAELKRMAEAAIESNKNFEAVFPNTPMNDGRQKSTCGNECLAHAWRSLC